MPTRLGEYCSKVNTPKKNPVITAVNPTHNRIHVDNLVNDDNDKNNNSKSFFIEDFSVIQ